MFRLIEKIVQKKQLSVLNWRHAKTKDEKKTVSLLELI